MHDGNFKAGDLIRVKKANDSSVSYHKKYELRKARIIRKIDYNYYRVVFLDFDGIGEFYYKEIEKINNDPEKVCKKAK